MVGWILADLMTKDTLLSRRKWASKNLISVNDFGLGKGQDFFGI